MSTKTVSIFKTDDEKRLVFGWASVAITVDGDQLEDRQQDMIDPEDLESAAYEYVLNFRDTGEEHIPSMRKRGKLVESCVFTVEKQKAMGLPEGILPVGWWIGFKIEDDDAWERVRNGTYRMFSIEGKAQREPVEIEKHESLDSAYDSQGVYVIINTNQYDHIQEIEKSARYDVIEEIKKFNPNHDPHTGQFANGSGCVDGELIKTDKQIGKKNGRHAKDFGLNPSNPEDRKKFVQIIDDIYNNPDEIRRGEWRGQNNECDFYIKGKDVVIVNGGKFVSILKGGVENARIKNARKQGI